MMMTTGRVSSAFFLQNLTPQRTTDTRLAVDPQELTDYMAKAHEEKLRAVKQAEDKKNDEIESLKKELKALKSSPGPLATTSSAAPVAPPASMDVSEMSKEQLAQKLLSYQQFMAKYIVDAQQQKTRAVAAAELAVTAKYEEKLKLVGGATEKTVPAAVSPPAAIPAFEQRTAKVSAAAAAGKSRWGDMENAKAIKATAASAATGNVVNGAAEEKANGAAAALASPSPVANSFHYDQRTTMVAAAGKAGKSRWGEMEVAKATKVAAALPAAAAMAPSQASAPAPANVEVEINIPDEVAAADHGLRADGGVSGPSLAERINFGAMLVEGANAPPVPVGKSLATVSYYDQRNAMVAAAGKAGKSRWGDMEIQKVETLVAALPASTASSSGVTQQVPVTVTPEIEAADHGLRADGGVTGPSLAQRVNFGATLLGQ